MIIDRLVIENFGPFRGEHDVPLTSSIYAITASRTADADSSNWAGKSTFLESIRFALYGEHRYRYDDDVISRGEAKVRVELHIGSTTIVRDRTRGKRTNITVRRGEEAFGQAEAESEIQRLVGLDKTDFENSCFFEQKKISRFIVARPEDRMAILSSWFHLEPLEMCEARARALAAEDEASIAKATTLLSAFEQRLRDLESVPEAMLQAKASKAREAIQDAFNTVTSLEEQLVEHGKLEAAQSQVAIWDQMVVEGKALRDEVAKRDIVKLRDSAQEVAQDFDEKSQKATKLKVIAQQRAGAAKSEFSGACPVANIVCPAKNQINADRAAASAAYHEADVAFTKAKTEADEARVAMQSAQAVVSEAERLSARLDDLRRRAQAMAATVEKVKAAGPPGDVTLLRDRLTKTRSTMLEAKGVLSEVDNIRQNREQAERGAAKLREAVAEVEKTIGVRRQAVTIFGKQGAQRRVAERALDQIQEGANEILRLCGAKLTVEARWAREGKGLASVCDLCGTAYPASTKVKACPKCAAPRGPKLENRMEVVLSDRSGAAEDLAGAAFQLAASKWLRTVRTAHWSVAFLDEPFTACDKPLRKGLARFLATSLPSIGFAQAFIVSHTVDTDLFPVKIRIVNDGTWSRIEVE